MLRVGCPHRSVANRTRMGGWREFLYFPLHPYTPRASVLSERREMCEPSKGKATRFPSTM